MRRWFWLGLFLLPMAAVVLDRRLDEGWGVGLAFAVAGLFGALVGAAELLSRYRDAPTVPLTTVPGIVYIGINALASLAALGLVRAADILADTTALPPPMAQVMLAGFGTMAFFRSALFTLRVGDDDVAVGPAAILNALLAAADRACDRDRAGPRSLAVQRIMADVSFAAAREALPTYCMSLMQNVAESERADLTRAVQNLSTTMMSDKTKALQLGLMLMNIVGEQVLEQAVATLGAEIQAPAESRTVWPAPPAGDTRVGGHANLLPNDVPVTAEDL